MSVASLRSRQQPTLCPGVSSHHKHCTGWTGPAPQSVHRAWVSEVAHTGRQTWSPFNIRHKRVPKTPRITATATTGWRQKLHRTPCASSFKSSQFNPMTSGVLYLLILQIRKLRCENFNIVLSHGARIWIQVRLDFKARAFDNHIYQSSCASQRFVFFNPEPLLYVDWHEKLFKTREPPFYFTQRIYLSTPLIYRA